MSRRSKIPIGLCDKLLFESNRTCCICETIGKAVQIHHIDLNSSNNSYDNLIVICLECHDAIHTKRTFGRNWTPGQLLKHKRDWINRVRIRKAKADKAASIQSVTGQLEVKDDSDNLDYKGADSFHLLKMYLAKLPIIHQGQLLIAKAEWNQPSPHGMIFGFGKLIDFYEAVLVELSTFYPKGQFDQKNPKIFFSEQISMRTSFAISKINPFGGHVGSSLDRDIAVENLTQEIKGMVTELVEQLITNSFDFDLGDFEVWIKQWNADIEQ